MSIRTPSPLNAEIYGNKVSSNYELLGEIKAITYNEMEISEKDGIFTVQAVVDL